ncbi:MAG TPA: hypothetical protein VKN99_25325, partial [Polyangia bacterium]|nr:hypothetical protein [Polyangia bacterium]
REHQRLTPAILSQSAHASKAIRDGFHPLSRMPLKMPLNHRPRKTLHFRTPYEIFFGKKLTLLSGELLRLGLEFSRKKRGIHAISQHRFRPRRSPVGEVAHSTGRELDFSHRLYDHCPDSRISMSGQTQRQP